MVAKNNPQMQCPDCDGTDLIARMTKKGVEVDYCPKCKGIWLDCGEIHAFARSRRKVAQAIERGLKKAGQTEVPPTCKIIALGPNLKSGTSDATAPPSVIYVCDLCSPTETSMSLFRRHSFQLILGF